jgi:hypothetical protein
MRVLVSFLAGFNFRICSAISRPHTTRGSHPDIGPLRCWLGKILVMPPALKFSIHLPCVIGLTIGLVSAASPIFKNEGTLEGFSGANQKKKITETRMQDHDGNGTSLQCLMLRAEPDTPTGGCHAEVHLNRFPTGEPIGKHPGFLATTSYRVKFDANCNAAAVAFFQYKNWRGPKQWHHLVAMWRESGMNGEEIIFQVNPMGGDRLLHARLTKEGGTVLVADRWHEIRVRGHFTNDPSGWVEVSINGRLIEWYKDTKFQQPIGKRITGKLLPDLPGSEWQLQLGAYGFFKDKSTVKATVHVDDIQVSGS